MEKNLQNIVDIKKYPINDLNSPKIKDLIKCNKSITAKHLKSKIKKNKH